MGGGAAAARAGRLHPRLGGFTRGGIVMIGVKWLTPRIEAQQRHQKRRPWGLTAAAAVDTAIEGATIGAGFTMGDGLGAVLSLALALELLLVCAPLGILLLRGASSSAASGLQSPPHSKFIFRGHNFRTRCPRLARPLANGFAAGCQFGRYLASPSRFRAEVVARR